MFKGRKLFSAIESEPAVISGARRKALDNRFRHGTVHFEAAGSVLLSGNSGMRFEKVTLDPEIGPETILILTDTTPFAYQLKHHQPFQLFLTSGAARTSLGPVLFLLWWMPPVNNGTPFALYEHIMNPAHSGTMTGLREAAHQTHLHAILVGPNRELLDVFEFENTFKIGDLVPIREWACKDYAGMNFAAAKEEYESTNDVMELFRKGISRA